MNEQSNFIIIDDTKYETKLTKKFLVRKPYTTENTNKVRAIIPGVIRNVFVTPGKLIKKGDKLLTLEAMKMNNIITSPFSGKIKSVNVSVGQIIVKGTVLIELE